MLANEYLVSMIPRWSPRHMDERAGPGGPGDIS